MSSYIILPSGAGSVVIGASLSPTIMKYPSSVPPTVTAVAPNIGSAAGGWPVQITGTAFVSGASVTIGGVAATSVVVVSATEITCVAPAYSGGANGSTSAQTVSVTTSGGTASGSGIPASYYYLPSNTAFAFAHQSNYGVTSSGGNVSAWSDISGNGANWAGTNNPTLGAGFNGTTFPYVMTDGSSSHLDLTLPGGGDANGESSMFLVGQQTVLPSSDQSIFAMCDGGTIYRSFRNFFESAYYISDLSVHSFQVGGTPDTNAHVYGFSVNSAGTGSVGYLDAATGTGTLNTGPVTTAAIGWIPGGIDYCAVRTMLDVGYMDQVSSGDAATIASILMTLGAT